MVGRKNHRGLLFSFESLGIHRFHPFSTSTTQEQRRRLAQQLVDSSACEENWQDTGAFFGCDHVWQRGVCSLPQIHSNRYSIWRYYEGIWGHLLYTNMYIYTITMVYPCYPCYPGKKHPFFKYSDSSLTHICFVNRVAIPFSGLGELSHGSSWDGAEKCGRTDRNWMIWQSANICCAETNKSVAFSKKKVLALRQFLPKWRKGGRSE